MEKQLCLFVGQRIPANVQRLLTNFGWMLSSDIDLHLLTNDENSITECIDKYYNIYGIESEPSNINQFKSLNSYLKNVSPDAVMNITRPALHGSVVGSQCLFRDIKYIYRYSGDTFYYYNGLTGIKKVGCFGVRNIIGYGVLQLGDQYIALGPTGKKRLVTRGITPDDITILPPTVNQDRFNSQKSNLVNFDTASDCSTILFVGRRTRMKGFDTLMRVIPSVLDVREDLQFVFVGGGDRTPNFPDEIQDHITVVGKVPPENVQQYYDAADLLVHPSLSEGVPRVVLESLSSGTPILARDVGDISYITDNTFSSDEEFKELLCEYEKLPLDSATEFTRENLQQDFIRFFSNI